LGFCTAVSGWVLDPPIAYRFGLWPVMLELDDCDHT